MSALSQGAAYLFGAIFILMAVSFLCQAINPDINRDERDYYIAMETLVEKNKIKEFYDRRHGHRNCKRICKSAWNPLYWILPI